MRKTQSFGVAKRPSLQSRKPSRSHTREKSAKLQNMKHPLHRQVEATDRQIDQLVYELYGLTDAEIRIVEKATR